MENSEFHERLDPHAVVGQLRHVALTAPPARSFMGAASSRKAPWCFSSISNLHTATTSRADDPAAIAKKRKPWLHAVVAIESRASIGLRQRK